MDKKPEKKNKGLLDYLASMMMPTPEQEQGERIMANIGEQEVDRQGNPIKKRRIQ